MRLTELYPNGGTPPTTTPQDVDPAPSGWLPNTGSEIDLVLLVVLGLLLIVIGLLVWHSRTRV